MRDPRIPRLALALAIALSALVAGAVLPPRAAAGDAPQAWERDLKAEVDAQNDAVDQARRAKTLGALVQRYASRVGRDPSALNHFLYGRALYYSEDQGGARAQMRAALEADPAFWPAHVKLALLAADAKNWDDADAHLREVFARRPDDPEALRLSARVAFAKKDWAATLTRLEAILAQDPADVTARNVLVRVHMERKDWMAALREIEVLRAREPNERGYRLLQADCLVEQGHLDEAAQALEALSREPPPSGEVLDRLQAIYARKHDLPKYQGTLERILPLLEPDKQKIVGGLIDALRHGIDPAAAPPAADRPVTFADVVAATRSQDVEQRRTALRDIFEATRMGVISQIPGEVLRRAFPDVEPDAECRTWAVKVLGSVTGKQKTGAVLLAGNALEDPESRIRMLAAEALGDLGEPGAIAFLLPKILDAVPSVEEANAMRAALARVVTARDLPPGVLQVSTPEEARAVREFWHRWDVSDESTGKKIEAVRQVAELPPGTAAWLLYRFVLDPDFSVMSEAYRAMRKATVGTPNEPVEKKLFPSFPSVPDERVTRASMADLQQRVRVWHDEWIAQRREWLRAQGR